MLDIRHLPNPIPDERVLHVLRRHPVTLLPLSGVTLLLFASPFAAWWLIAQSPDVFESNANLLPLVVMGGSIFFLFAWLFIFQRFVDYYLDTWIVTSKRILNIETQGLFNRTVSELRMHRVQDVTSIVKGFWRTLFNYGNLEIQTAGEKRRFMFEQIPDPVGISKVVVDCADKCRREQVDETIEEFGMIDKPSAGAVRS